jgi:hypothetical protein
MANILDVILNTINDVQKKNKSNPNVDTADPTVFDLLRDKISDLNGKQQQNQMQKGRKNAKSILDILKDGIEGARKENKKDPNVATAPKSVFDDILKKVDQGPARQASTGIKKIIEEYNLDTSRIPSNMLQEIQAQYLQDMQKMKQQYAQGIFDLTKKYR